MNLRPIKKAIAPFLLSLVGVLVGWVTTGDLSTGEALMAASGILGALGVWIAPNIESVPWLKALVPAFMGAVALAQRTIETQTFEAMEWRILGGSALSAALVYFVRNGTGYHDGGLGASTALLLVAALAGSVLVTATPADAARAQLVARVSFSADQLAGFAAGSMDQYSDDSVVVRVRLRDDLGTNADGTENDAKSAEWEWNLYASDDCSGGATVAHDPSQLKHFHFGNPPDQYGPRILQRYLDGPLFHEIGSVELVHDGPLSDHGQTTKGRHHLACVPFG